MKKTIGWSLATLISFALIGQAATVYLYQQQREKMAESMLQDPEISIRLEQHQDSWWQQQERWVIKRNIADLALDESLPQEIEIALEQSVSVFPGYIKAEWHLDPEFGTLAEIQQQYQLKPLRYQASWSSFLPNQTVQHYFATENYQWQDANITLNIEPIEAFSSHDYALSYTEAAGTFAGLSLASEQHQFSFSLEQLKFKERLRDFSGLLFAEQMEWSIDKLNASDGDASQISMEQLHSAGTVNQEQDTLSLDMQVKLASLTFSDGYQAAGQLKDFIFTSQLRDIDMESFIALQQLDSSDPMASEAALQALGNQLLAKGLGYNIEQLSFQLDNELPFALSGDLKLNGDLNLAPSEEPLLHPMQALANLEVKASVDIAEQLLNGSPFTSQVEMLRQQGLLLNEAQRDTAEIIYNHSEFTVNGQPVPF